MPKLRLDSWKSIAEHLERSQRTVQRWHRFHALPVHHFCGHKGSVFAYADEIDSWLLSVADNTPSPASEPGIVLDAQKQTSIELAGSALQMWETHSDVSLNTIAALYRRAVELYPGNAAALLGLANAMIAAAVEGMMDGAVAYPCAAEALRRVQSPDAQSAEAKCAVAWLRLLHDRRATDARLEFQDLLRRQPQCAFALVGLALAFVSEGDLYSASSCAWKAWRMRPLISAFGALVCWTQYLAGDLVQTLELIAQVRASGGGGLLLGTIEALALIQNSADAHLDRIETIAGIDPQSQTLQGVLAYLYAATGQTNRARTALQALEQASGAQKRGRGYGLAIALIGLGRGNEAGNWLEAEYQEGSLWSLGFRSDPILQQLHGDQGYEALVKRDGNSAGREGTQILSLVELSRAV